MHRFAAIQIDDAENLWHVFLRAQTSQRYAGNGAQIHGNDAGLLGEPVVNSFDHENRSSGLRHVSDHTVAGIKFGLRESATSSVLTGGILKPIALSDQHERPFSAADFERRL